MYNYVKLIEFVNLIRQATKEIMFESVRDSIGINEVLNQMKIDKMSQYDKVVELLNNSTEGSSSHDFFQKIIDTEISVFKRSHKTFKS